MYEIDTKNKMIDLAEKLNGKYWTNNNQHIVTKLKDGIIYDIIYIVLRRCFMLKNIKTKNKIFIKKRNAVISFMINNH